MKKLLSSMYGRFLVVDCFSDQLHFISHEGLSTPLPNLPLLMQVNYFIMTLTIAVVLGFQVGLLFSILLLFCC